MNRFLHYVQDQKYKTLIALHIPLNKPEEKVKELKICPTYQDDRRPLQNITGGRVKNDIKKSVTNECETYYNTARNIAYPFNSEKKLQVYLYIFVNAHDYKNP